MYQTRILTSKLLLRQTEWMSGVLSKISAASVVDIQTEQKLDELRRTVGVVQHLRVFHICKIPIDCDFAVMLSIHEKNEGCGDIIPANFLDFPPNFRLRTQF